MVKTEEELSEVPLSGKTFHMRHGVGEKNCGCFSKVFQSVSIYKRALTPLRELRLEKGDAEIRTTKALQTSAALLSDTRARERERVVFLGGT